MTWGWAQEPAPVVKTGDEVFAKWLAWQRVVEAVQPKSFLKANVFQNNGQDLKNYYKKKYDTIFGYKYCLNSLTDGFFSDSNGLVNLKTNKTFMRVYNDFDHDIGDLLNLFQLHGFVQGAVNKEEQGLPVEVVVQRCRSVLKTFFPIPDHKVRYQYCFNVATRMFDWCFGEKTHKNFSTILMSPEKHQLARFCHGVMWYYLVGEGWKHWHKDCLTRVVKEAKAGKEIVYIAGGNDIYQLLKNGVYNIRVIDPLLPSQPEYYSEGWSWFVEGTIGDKLDVDLGNKKRVLLKREKHEQKGTFQADLSTGQMATLPLSVTHWSVYDANGKKKLGTVIFDRRFCMQDDFVYDKKKAYVISFNEMYFVAIPPRLQGWGIDVSKFDSKFAFHVKQLDKPVGKPILTNLCKSEDTPFSFILLGSCAT